MLGWCFFVLKKEISEDQGNDKVLNCAELYRELKNLSKTE